MECNIDFLKEHLTKTFFFMAEMGTENTHHQGYLMYLQLINLPTRRVDALRIICPDWSKIVERTTSTATVPWREANFLGGETTGGTCMIMYVMYVFLDMFKIVKIVQTTILLWKFGM